MNLKCAKWLTRWIWAGCLLLTAPITMSAGGKRGAGDLSGPWQLFVDDSLVADSRNLRRTYHPFNKHPGNPVLVPDKPWEGRVAYAYGTVLPDFKKAGYRLWYQAWASGEYRNLYATSVDGIHWDKPALGLVDYQGSKSNNIVLRRTREDHLPQVIHTPWERDKRQRYKLINYDYGRTPPDHVISGYWGAHSADGIHWQDAPTNPILKDPGDVGNFVWDSHARRYMGYPKIFETVRGFRRRCVGFSATPDFEHWPTTQLALAPDEDDDRWVAEREQRTEFYGLSAFPYESAYIGFLWIFRITDGKNDGPIFCELVSSRDGVHWTRQDLRRGGRVPVLPLGPAGAWDAGMVFTTSHPLANKDTLSLWYGGFNTTHGAPDSQSHGAIGLATLRKDGFASLDAGAVEGSLTTQPLTGLSGGLLVNADASRGRLLVEVLSEDGRVMPGFERAACEPVRGDGVCMPVRWHGKSNLPRVKRPLRLRFHLQQGSIYSFMAGPKVGLARSMGPATPLPNPRVSDSQSTHWLETVETCPLPDGSDSAPYRLLRPPGAAVGGKSPLLIFLYGAGGSHEDYNLKRPPYDGIRRFLASNGYYILVPELGPSHWMNPDAEKLLDAMVDQVLTRHPVDPARVQIMGTSMGGGSALAYAIHRPDLIRSVCSHLGMTDFAQWIRENPAYFPALTKAYGGSPSDVPDRFRARSAMQNLDAFSNIPVFLISAAKDTTVLPHHGRQLARALSDKGYCALHREAKNLGHEDKAIEPFGDDIVDFLGVTAGFAPVQRGDSLPGKMR